jgi:hypothetical protein
MPRRNHPSEGQCHAEIEGGLRFTSLRDLVRTRPPGRGVSARRFRRGCAASVGAG